MTQRGVGDDEPRLISCSGSSGSEASDTTAPDSGVNLASPIPSRMGQKKARLNGPTASSNASRTPPLSPDTRRELDAEAQGGDESQMDDDNPLSGASDHPLSDADVDGDHESGVTESSDKDDGGDGSGKDMPMDAETASQQAPPPTKETAMPSTSSNPATGTTPEKTEKTAPDPTSDTTPGAPSGNPGGPPKDTDVPDPSAALAYAIQARVLASPALAVVMAQLGPGVALDGWRGRQDPARGIPRCDARPSRCCPDHVLRIRKGQPGCPGCGE